MKAKEKKRLSDGKKRAFTIVEVVLVIAVIAILAAILVPVFANVTDDAAAMARKIDIEGAYTAFAADELFNEHDYMPIGEYLFLEAGTFNYTPAKNGSPAVFSNLTEGYRLPSNDDDVVIVAPGAIRQPDTKTGVFGPYNGYYVVGYDIINPSDGGASAWPWKGEGSKAAPFLVEDYQGLRAISEYCAKGEGFAGKYFKLTTSDINIKDNTWIPIGGYTNPTTKDSTEKTSFRGNFDGDGHLITLSYGRVDRENYTLFGKTKDATIYNVRTAGTITLGGYGWLGGVVGYAKDTKIYNCISDMKATAGIMIGGIAGQIAGTTEISSCVNRGVVTATGFAAEGYNNFVGGIVGATEPTTVVRSCYNKGAITGNAGVVGGIAGYAPGKIISCQNDAAITAKGFAPREQGDGVKDASVGGIVGYGGMKGVIDGCVNNGNVQAYNAGTGTYYRSVGGIVGTDALVRNCVNTGKIVGSAYIGGIAGFQNGTAACSMYNNINKGDVAGKGDTFSGTMTGPTGGILGGVGDTNGFRFALNINRGTSSYRLGDSSVTSYSRIGSLIGSANNPVDFEYCFSVCWQGITVGTTTKVNQVIGPAVPFVEEGEGIPLGTPEKKSGIFYADLAHLEASGYPDKKLNAGYYYPWPFSSVHAAFNDLINSTDAALASIKKPEFANWACYSGIASGLCVPMGTKYKATYSIGTVLEHDGSVSVLHDTSLYMGDNVVYAPYLNKTQVIKGNMQYIFQGWSDGTKTYQPGEKITLTKNITLTAIWKQETYTIRPVPFPG